LSCQTYRWPEERRAQVEDAIRGSRTRADAAKRLDITLNSLDHACAAYGIKPGPILNRKAEPVQIEIEAPPSARVPTEELIEDRKRRYERRHKHELARKLIPITVKERRPIGLHIFGDPHVDDDGCDLAQLERHVEIVKRTPGLYAINAGDTTNNWTGRLARLYANQSTTAAEAWQIAEWFVSSLRKRWLFIIGGNHDLWSGAGDPLQWICGQAGALYQPSAVRVALRFPGALEVRINSRHDFKGSSVWNPAHGPMKAAQMGFRDHLFVAGHLHTSAYGLTKDPDSGIAMHAVRVASYKVHDDYAHEEGMRDQHLSPCALVTVNPALPAAHPDLLKVFWDPEEGSEYLTWLRARKV
jgi:hypothetical protein